MSFIDDAKRRLGIDRLALQIHDASFPSESDEDSGRGSPWSYGARRFMEFIQRMGFDAVQFGPQGQTSHGNACPYDGRLFPHDYLSVALAPLARDPYWRGLLSESTLNRIVAGKPPGQRVHHEYAWEETAAALDEVFATWRVRGDCDTPLDDDFRRFVADHHDWLHHIDESSRQSRDVFVQFLLYQQRMHVRAAFPQLRFLGDLQIGMGPEDARKYAALFDAEYAMGAPPSRTNPEGQPWGYAVFSAGALASGSAQEFLRHRVRRMLVGLDGIRIDHPHGLVCPWVYRRDQQPAHLAVQSGARLYESPGSNAHPALAALAIARTEQLNESVAAYAEDRVRDLDEEQVERYSVLMDVVLQTVRDAGGSVPSDVACEVLSTLPYPLQRVMRRYGLGRFRVVQKAQLDNPADVYRIEQAQPEDWIMPGNHDTPPIWLLARGWCDGSRGRDWSIYLADQLRIPAESRGEFMQKTSQQPSELIHAMVAAMLASRARHVSIFFPDLLGITSFYNKPGVVNYTNWKLRVPCDFENDHRRQVADGAALDMERCFRMALDARDRMTSN